VRDDSELAPSVRHDEQLWSAPFQNWQQSDDPVKRAAVAAITKERQRARLPLSGSERNHLFLNRRGEQFLDVSGVSALDSPADGRAFAVLDYDRDGWPDIAVVNSNAPWCNLYHNDLGQFGRPGSFIAVRFVGGNEQAKPSSKFSARDGYGAKVSLKLNDLALRREHRCGEGLAAQNSATMLIGIGSATAAESVSIEWPSGRKQPCGAITAGMLLTVYENAAESPDDRGFTTQPYRRPVTPPVAKIDAAKPPRLSWVAERGALSTAGAAPHAALDAYVTMATWCVACRRELPLLRRLKEAFSDDELAIHGVPIDPRDDADALSQFVASNRPPYKLLMNLKSGDAEETSELIKQRLHQEVLPATVVTDAVGNVRLIVAGVPTVSDLRRLLARPASAGP